VKRAPPPLLLLLLLLLLLQLLQLFATLSFLPIPFFN
jgi:hypothetical protein